MELEQEIKLAEYLGYKSNPDNKEKAYFFDDENQHFLVADPAKGNAVWELFTPESDWNIIKQLEEKMCQELGVTQTEYYMEDKEMVYWKMPMGYVMRGEGTDEKSAILNAVMKHIEKKHG
jgi:hypothetical protein